MNVLIRGLSTLVIGLALTGCNIAQPIVKEQPMQHIAQEQVKKPVIDNSKTYDKNGKLISEIISDNDGVVRSIKYTYYDNGVRSMKTHYKNNLKDGREEVYSPNGSLTWYISYKNDILNGEYQDYHENGNKQFTSFYLNDKYDGISTKHDIDGRILFDGKYADGVLIEDIRYEYTKDDDGSAIYYKRTYLKDKLVNAKKYNEFDTLILDANFDGENLHGDFKSYYKNGNLESTIHYKNNKINGTKKSYFKNGDLKSTLTNIIDGEDNGTYTEYYSNGQIKLIVEYKNNLMNGKKKGYYDNGTLEYEVVMKDDNPVGKLLSYYSNGNISAELEFDKDKKLISEKTYTMAGKVKRDLKNETGVVKDYFDSGELSWEVHKKNNKYTKALQYYKAGKLAKEIYFKNGKAIDGWIYSFEGEKTKMTNAHFENLGYEY